MRRDLVANVSHDLRTPVAAVHGYLETLLLKEAVLAPDERRRYLEVALRHSAGLSAMIMELFDLAKLDAREVDVELEPFSLCELGQDVLQRFELLAAQKNVALEGVLSPTLPMVAADIRLIERVLVNLIDNALRHSPSGGRVSLICVADGADVSGQHVLDQQGPGVCVHPGGLAAIVDHGGNPDRGHDRVAVRNRPVELLPKWLIGDRFERAETSSAPLRNRPYSKWSNL